MPNDRYIIDRMNPFLKILVLILVTLIGSIEFYPYLPAIFIVLGFITASTFSSISFFELLNTIKVFIIMSLGFMVFILFSRYISKEPLMFISVLGLGLKIILISLYTAVFVKTTDPTEFVIALIKYFKIPSTYAYAFLAAYRFLPTFKEDYEIIRHAYQVRGVAESKNIFVKIFETKRYIIPMMATAVRKGIRISMAMETRAFGKYKTRTYYRQLTLSKGEVITSTMYIALLIMITITFYNLGLTNMGLKFLG